LDSEDQMKAIRNLVLSGSLVLLAGVGACRAAVDANSTEAVQSALAGEPAETGQVPARLIRDALAHVSLRADQKAEIDRLANEAETRHAGIQRARQLLNAAVADQVQAGKVDRAVLQPLIDALLASIEQTRPADRAAIVRLHDILDKQQRSQLVDALDASLHERKRRHQGMHETRGIAKDLSLTEQQQQQIRAAVRANFDGGHGKRTGHWKEAREHGATLLESFRQDQFSLDQNAATLWSGEWVQRRVGRLIDIAEAALPVLTVEQRARAAELIRARGKDL
jgi:Spy/CpxP family protein refolding chaperone